MKMDLSKEAENFIKIAKIVLEIFPKHLRKLFVKQWNIKYKPHTWGNDVASGALLLNEIQKHAKNRNFSNRYFSVLSKGNEEDWDTTALAFILLLPNLNLIQDRQINNEIHYLKNIRNEVFAHSKDMSYPSSDFNNLIEQIKNASNNVFGIDAKDEIEKIETSQVTTAMTKQLENILNVEMKQKNELDMLLKDVEGKFSYRQCN